MTGHVKVSGSFKTIDSIGTKVSGNWKTVSNAYVKVSGVWKEWFATGGGGGGDVVTVPAVVTNNYVTYNPPFETTSTCSIGFNRNGTTVASNTSPADWVAPSSPSVGDAYEIRATVLSGDTPSGSALNTWLPLSTARSWSLTASGPTQSKSCDLSVEIGLLGTSTPLSTNTSTITAAIDTA